MENNSTIAREDILGAYFAASQLVVQYGPAYLPAFERLQQEINRLDLKDEMMARALAVVEGKRKPGGMGD
ncbi:MAG: hypothetical protein AAFQ12_14985 [Pseudomonadota bacterium]